MNISEILNFLQDNYSFFGKNVTIQSFNQKKSNNQNFLISSKKEKFVLHIINENISAKQIEKICKILQFCNDDGARVQSLIKNSKGKFGNEKFLAYLTRYTVGKQSSGKNLELINLAKHLAKLHSVFAKCKIPYHYRMNQSFYQILTKQDIKQIKNIINKKSQKDKFDKNVLKNLNLLSNVITKLYRFNLKLKPISKQLIHFDLHPDNVLFQNDDVIAFLDFNSIRKGIIWEDVAFSSFRFALLSKKHQRISHLMKIFVKCYQEYSNSNIKFSELNNFLLLRILKSISYILKKRYFSNEKIWIQELEKYLRFLYIANKLNLK